MRILLITQWFDPEPTFKGQAFARALGALGHEVQVLTGFPNYPGGRIYPGYRLRPFQREIRDGVAITRVPLYPSHDGSALGRIANYVSFACSAALAAPFLRRPDVVYLYHPPGTAALPAIVLKLLRGVPFVVDIQDLWPDTLGATGMVRNPRMLSLVGRWMDFVYAQAAHIGVLSPGFRHRLMERGSPGEKITVIPNWTYEDDTPSAPEKAPAVLANGIGSFDILFAGNMGKAQALETVLDAAAMLTRELPAARFHFMGSGVEVDRLKTIARQRALENVVLHPRRPAHAMPAVLAQADMLLVHLNDDPLFEITIPSKTQAYLQAGRPILMGVRGDAAALVADAKAGLFFPPQDAQALVDAVRAAAAMPRAELEAMGAAGADYYRRNLSLPVGTGRWAKLLSDAQIVSRPTLRLKRLFDCGVAAIALVLLSPLLAVVAIFVRIRLGSPILFRQQRPGRFGRIFRMYKFRTMTDARGHDGVLLSDRERLTAFGTWLRTTSLDELPSLLNVLSGDMSFVGPRPLLVRYTRFFREDEMPRLMMRPGITGWAQVNGRNHASWDDRLAMDVWYVRNWSLRLDFRILVRTALKVLRRQDIAPDAEAVMLNLDEERAGEAAR